MLMYTSCGWFFDELSGIETVQVIQYAGRVVQLSMELFGDHLEERFLEKLAKAKSNLPEHSDGAEIYAKFVKPAMVNPFKMAAHYAISSLFQNYEESARICSYTVTRQQFRTMEAGKLRMAVGRARFTSEITQRTDDLTFGVLHFGDHNLHAGVRAFSGSEQFAHLNQWLAEAFENADLAEAIRLMDKGFGTETYSLKDLFKDEQRRVVAEILKSTLGEAEAAYGQLYGNHAPLMRFLMSCGIPLPREMKSTAEYALNSLLRHEFSQAELNFGHIRNLVSEAAVAGVTLDNTTLEFTLRKTLERLSDRFVAAPFDLPVLQRFRDAIGGARTMPFTLVFWSMQNDSYEILRREYPHMLRRARAGDENAKEWTDSFRQLADLLSLKVQAE
jgi:hypothetical protein